MLSVLTRRKKMSKGKSEVGNEKRRGAEELGRKTW